MVTSGPRPHRVAWGFLDLAEGGAQRATLLTLRHLSRQRFDPALLLARGGGALEARALAAGVPVVRCGRLERPWDAGAIAALAGALASLVPAALEVPLYSRASPYLRLAARRAGVPLVIAHEWERGAPPTWPRRLADRLLRPGTRFVAASDFHARRLIAAGAAPGRVEVVRNGIEVERYATGARGATRVALGVPPAALLLLTPARLHPAKGHRDLIAALAEVRRARPEATLLLAGEGPERGALAALARGLGQASAVRFLGHREDLPDLLAAADLVVLPSLAEGLPAALLEALAAGRAAVATEVGGVPEAVTDGREGRLVPAGAPAALASAILELLAAPDRRAALGEAGQARVRGEFAIAPATRRYESVLGGWLEEVAARRRERAA